jgi:hypothetical protein
MTKYLFVIFPVILLFVSCNDVKKEDAKIFNKAPNWNVITLKSDLQSIKIHFEYDSLISTSWRLKDSLSEQGERYRFRTDIKQEVIYLEPKCKDSLYLLVKDLITNPVYTDQSATCYVGSLSACIQSQNTEICCNYSSVGNWTTISVSTKKIYQILSRKIKVNKE